MSNPNFKDSQSYSKGIFVNTIELIGSIIMFALFITVMYGIFMAKLDEMLWELFDWFIKILQPIAAIILLFVALFRGIPLLVSIIESILEERRLEKESLEIWRQFESSPTPSNQPKIESKQPLEAEIIDTSTESRGETEIIWEPTATGAIAHHLVKGSKEWQAQIKRNAEKQAEIEKAELLEKANDRLAEQKHHFMQPKFESNEGCKLN